MGNGNNKIKLFNLFAELCAYIVKLHTKDYLVQYGCISKDERKRIVDAIEDNTFLKRGDNGKFLVITSDEINDKFMKTMISFTEELRLRDDNNCIMGLIQALDGAMSDILKNEIKYFQNETFTEELNTNRDETGIGLLPRCSCVWARKSRMSYSYRRIANFLKHFMVMENRVLDNINDRHIFLKQGFFENFDKTKKLKVAASPLVARPTFDIEYQDNSNFQVFSVKYDRSTMDEENELVWQRIVDAGKEEAEIVVFPEMLGNANMEKFIRDKLYTLDEKHRKEIPAMIVLPSYSNNRKNVTTILDRYGRRIADQHKQNPYVMIGKHGQYMEDIMGSNGIVNIFHYEGIGRFAILICKDFLTTRYMERIMRGFMLTMIIVPAYSTGAYDFKMSFDLCAHDYCNVIWINSCAAMKPGKEMNFENIGYIRKRISRYEEETEALYNMKPCKGLF